MNLDTSVQCLPIVHAPAEGHFETGRLENMTLLCRMACSSMLTFVRIPSVAVVAVVVVVAIEVEVSVAVVVEVAVAVATVVEVAVVAVTATSGSSMNFSPSNTLFDTYGDAFNASFAILNESSTVLADRNAT